MEKFLTEFREKFLKEYWDKLLDKSREEFLYQSGDKGGILGELFEETL